MIINTDEWLTAAEAENSINKFAGFIRQEIRRGKLDPEEYTKIGHTWLVKKTALKKYEGN
jgi:hypothetical protein